MCRFRYLIEAMLKFLYVEEVRLRHAPAVTVLADTNSDTRPRINLKLLCAGILHSCYAFYARQVARSSDNCHTMNIVVSVSCISVGMTMP